MTNTTQSNGRPAWMLPAIEDEPLPLDWEVATGLGVGSVEKDGVCIYYTDDNNIKLCSEFEAMAAQDPNHDWRIIFQDPGIELFYQRQGPKLWMLIDRNGGVCSYGGEGVPSPAA